MRHGRIDRQLANQTTVIFHAEATPIDASKKGNGPSSMPGTLSILAYRLGGRVEPEVSGKFTIFC